MEIPDWWFIGEFDRHQAIRYTVIGVERRLLQAERGSALL